MGDSKLTKKIVLFCDFDGTITDKDNIVDIMREFAPASWREIVDDILQQRKSVKSGVGQLFSLIPSEKREEITHYVVTNSKIRNGFEAFLDFVQKEGIELLITSGGIDFFVYPILAPYFLEGKVYCNGSDFSDETIRITWPYGCDEECDVDCGMCKSTIIRSYPADKYYKVVIGDSITDLAGARLADFTICRSFLKQKCEELSLPHASFEDFYDVLQIMKRTVVEEVSKWDW
jgi:2-hydroxy-3-keto-5-methylthiopentenyl-1-phosphate phosphatase